MVAALALFALFFTGLVYSVDSYHSSGQERVALLYARAKSHQSSVLADMNLLKERPPFPAWTRERNAEPLLSQHISWLSSSIPALQSADHQQVKEIQNKFKQLSEAKNYQALLADPVVRAIDVRWMESLLEFDHWALTTAQATQPYFALAQSQDSISRIGNMASLPMPDFQELRGFALVYLAQKTVQGKPLEGLKVYRKASELAHSSSTLVGNMIAVAMLNTERDFVAHLSVPEWQVVPKDVALAYKRASWGMIGLAQLPWHEEMSQELASAFDPRLGVCAAIAESSSVAFINMADFFEPRIAFESDYSANYKRTREFIGKMNEACGLKSYDVFLTRSPASVQELPSGSVFRVPTDESPEGIESMVSLRHVPYIRRAMGMILIGIASPNWFRQYEE